MSVTEALAVRHALDQLRVGSLVATIAHVGALVNAAQADDSTEALEVLAAAAADESDQLTAIAAVHALGARHDAASAELLATLLDGDQPYLREHAAWALRSHPFAGAALPALVPMVASGGFAGVMAQCALEAAAAEDPDRVRAALLGALEHGSDDGRMRLVETMGLVSGASTARILNRIAADDREPSGARAAAVAALGDLADPSDRDVRVTLDALARAAEPLAGVARIALGDIDGRQSPTAHGETPTGLTVAQLFLHADIDGSLLRAGQGDTGGIATLLVHLGDALVTGPNAVGRVVTISRGRSGDTADGEAVERPGHHYLTVPLWGPPVPAATAWPLRIPVRRAMRRILARFDVDVLHLRMADVASWAGAEAARELDVPVVMTVAPDPHAVVAAREADGALTRASFGVADAAEHLVFRIRLLQELQDQAAHLVAFPRPALDADLRGLLGLELSDHRDRITVVPEGIDLGPLDRAAREVAADLRGESVRAETAAALHALDEVLETLPPERRRLPLALTVGRLHRVKGMATLAEAWVRRPDLAARCNLVIVGGDLHHPTVDEREQLDLIEAALDQADAAAAGLLLAGHRPNATVAVWLAAALRGRRGLSAPHGVYVSASLKEEFGIAILEAMASGLVVVAPWEGGPATYVDDGVTGILADTRSPAALADAIGAALNLAAAPDAERRADEARRLVREQFGIQTMATALAAIYRDLAG